MVSSQFLLLYFLYQSYNAPSDNEIYKEYYLHVLHIIRIAEQIFIQVIHNNDQSINPNLNKLFINSPFGLPLTTFGNLNIDLTYIFSVAYAVKDLNDVENIPSILNLSDIDLMSLLEGLPTNYYPEKRKKKESFDYSKNLLFIRDGSKIQNIKLYLKKLASQYL